MSSLRLPWPIVAVLALGLAAGVWGGLGGALADDGLSITFLATAVVVTARAFRGPERLAWSIVAAGLWSYAAGQVTYTAWVMSMADPPFPSISDWLWLGLPVASLFGMVALAGARGIRAGFSSVLDGIIVATALWGVLAALVYEPVYDDLLAQGGAFGMVLSMAELAVVSAVVVGAAARRWHAEASGLAIAACFLLLTVGDSIYAMAVVSTGWTPGTWLDFLYAAGVTLLGAAAWLPVRGDHPAGNDEERSLAIPLAAGCVAVVLVGYGVVADLNPVANGAIIVLVCAVVARKAFALRQWTSLLRVSRREAHTDQLTGLGNRRLLLSDLREGLGGPPSTLMLFDLDGFKAYNDTHGHSAGDELLKAFARRLAQTLGGQGRAYRMGGDEFCVLVPADRRDLRTEAAAALSCESGGFRVTSSWGEVDIPAEARSAGDALRIADRRMYAMKNGRPNAPGTQLREALNRVVKIREPDLHEHVVDVGRMAAAVAERMGLREHEWSDIVHAAELHDVGKLAIPEAILNKPGPLDEEEWVVMRRHTILGEQLLSGIPALVIAARLVRASHEAWDGSGYPDGLSAEDIPLGARIIAACDAYDAMVTDRPYRAGMSHEEAVAELRRCAGTQFDPYVVDALVAELAARRRFAAAGSAVA